MWGDVGPRSPPPARPPQQTPPHPGRFLRFPWGAASRRYRLCRGAGTRPAASGAGGERIAAPASAEACARVCVCGRSLWASESAPVRPPPLQGEAAAAPGTPGGDPGTLGTPLTHHLCGGWASIGPGSWHSRGRLPSGHSPCGGSRGGGGAKGHSATSTTLLAVDPSQECVSVRNTTRRRWWASRAVFAHGSECSRVSVHVCVCTGCACVLI